MTDFFWPSSVVPSSSQVALTDTTARFTAPYSGYTRTVSRPGGQLIGLSLGLQNQSGVGRAALRSFLAAMRGGVHRVWCRDHGYKLRGSFPTGELLSNNTFANGTTGWTATNATLTAPDRVLRMTATTPAANVQLYRSVALTQYAPHVLRSMILDGLQTPGLSIGPFLSLGAAQSMSDYSTARGIKTVSGVADDATSRSQFPAVFSSTTGFSAGAYVSVPWASLSRCALVDNGRNVLLQSDDFTTTWVNTRSTDAANSTAAPDRTTTADSIIEDATASNTHSIGQAVTVIAAVADRAFSISLKAGTRTFARVSMVESTGSHECYVDVNLSTGALGTATASSTNWTNPRAFVVNEGNGWYRVTIVGRKVSAATTVTPSVYLATALGTTSYSGDGTSLIYAWRGSLAQSSVPVRGVQTTTAAAAGTAQTGSALNVKGLPASTSGLLLPGDEFQIGNELKLVTAALDSNAAGLGYLQFEPPLRTASVNDGPVIIHEPMGKFLLANDGTWSNAPGGFMSSSIDLIEAA